jgi:hypothetical protein
MIYKMSNDEQRRPRLRMRGNSLMNESNLQLEYVTLISPLVKNNQSVAWRIRLLSLNSPTAGAAARINAPTLFGE